MTFKDCWRSAGPWRWLLVLLPLFAGLGTFLVAGTTPTYQARTDVSMPVPVGLVTSPPQVEQLINDFDGVLTSDSFRDDLKKAVPAATDKDVSTVRGLQIGASRSARITLRATDRQVANDLAANASELALKQLIAELLAPQPALVKGLADDLDAARRTLADLPRPAANAAPSPDYAVATGRVAELATLSRSAEDSLRETQAYATAVDAEPASANFVDVRPYDPAVGRTQLAVAAVVGGLALGAAVALLAGALRLRRAQGAAPAHAADTAVTSRNASGRETFATPTGTTAPVATPGGRGGAAETGVPVDSSV